jgi:hypothetical protein
VKGVITMLFSEELQMRKLKQKRVAMTLVAMSIGLLLGFVTTQNAIIALLAGFLFSVMAWVEGTLEIKFRKFERMYHARKRRN